MVRISKLKDRIEKLESRQAIGGASRSRSEIRERPEFSSDIQTPRESNLIREPPRSRLPSPEYNEVNEPDRFEFKAGEMLRGDGDDNPSPFFVGRRRR